MNKLNEEEIVEMMGKDQGFYEAIMRYGNDLGGTPRDIALAAYRALLSHGVITGETK